MPIEATGFDQIMTEIDKVRDPAVLRRAMLKLLAMIDGEIKARMRDSGSPSQPFNPPGIDTGALVRSMRFWVDSNGAEVVGMLYSGVAYAYYLETGTVNMDPRPVWWDTTIEMIEIFGDGFLAEMLGGEN